MPIKIKLIGADALIKIGKLASESKEKLMLDLFKASDDFGTDAVSIAKRSYLKGPRPEHLDIKTGRLSSSIDSKVTRKGPVIETVIGTNVEYARIHEYGGVVRPTLTDKMREFAWAMFFKTKDDKWKGLALSSKSRLRIKIPPRPFLRPALQDAMPEFQDNIRRILTKLSFASG